MPSSKNKRPRQPQENDPLRALQQALGLQAEGWATFLRLIKAGLTAEEREEGLDGIPALRWNDLPTDWFRRPELFGYITIYTIRNGGAALAVPVARFFLEQCAAASESFDGPPGVGLAWLYLMHDGIPYPVKSARLEWLALEYPKDFFQNVTEEELFTLSRLLLESSKGSRLGTPLPPGSCERGAHQHRRSLPLV